MNMPGRENQSLITLFTVFPRVAGGLLAVSALIYLIGLSDVVGYYFMLGAPWAVSGLSTAQVMRASALPILECGILAFSIARRTGRSPKVARILLRDAAIVSFCILLLVFGMVIFFAVKMQLALSLISSTLTPTAGVILGVTLAALLAGTISIDKNYWRVILIALLVTVVIPFISGLSSAKNDSAGDVFGFPKVVMNENDNENPRLVGYVGENLLIIKESDADHRRSFVLVKPEDIVSIGLPENRK